MRGFFKTMFGGGGAKKVEKAKSKQQPPAALETKSDPAAKHAHKQDADAEIPPVEIPAGGLDKPAKAALPDGKAGPDPTQERKQPYNIMAEPEARAEAVLDTKQKETRQPETPGPSAAKSPKPVSQGGLQLPAAPAIKSQSVPPAEALESYGGDADGQTMQGRESSAPAPGSEAFKFGDLAVTGVRVGAPKEMSELDRVIWNFIVDDQTAEWAFQAGHAKKKQREHRTWVEENTTRTLGRPTGTDTLEQADTMRNVLANVKGFLGVAACDALAIQSTEVAQEEAAELKNEEPRQRLTGKKKTADTAAQEQDKGQPGWDSPLRATWNLFQNVVG